MKINLFPSLIIFFLLTTSAVFAQDDILDLSLEELMDLQIKRTTIIDVPHMHDRGDFMVTYKYMVVNMPGLKNNSTVLTTEEILVNYVVTPTNMKMAMHMIGVMWAPTTNINIMGMLPYNQMNMQLQMRNGATFSTSSSGIGDFRILGLFSFKNSGSRRLFATLGASLPFGSVDARDETPISMGNKIRLPYPMQLGSGTIDPTIGITAIKIKDKFGMGVNINGTLRLYKNKYDYKKGDELKVIGWYSYILKDYFTITSKLDYLYRGDYSGVDSELNSSLIPTSDPNLQSGSQLSVGLGVNILPFSGKYDQFRFTLEGSLPFYQNLAGPQMYKVSEVSLAVSNVF